MPTVARIGPYRFFFYSADRVEPPHVHVAREANCAKFWLDPVRLNSAGGFDVSELWRIAKIVSDNEEVLHRAWIEFFENVDR